MLRSLRDLLFGVTSLVGLTATLFFWLVPFTFLAILKVVTRDERRRARITLRLAAIVELWVSTNALYFDHVMPIDWHVQGTESLTHDETYVIVANHQSWADIPVLFHVFNRRIPVLRFFLKRELIWLPGIGFGCWALDFPFMRRYTKEEIERDPELRTVDFEATRRACRKYEFLPVSILIFLEGTRFRTAKREEQGSPYQRLLRPKSGGLAYVLSAMGSRIDALVDVTIVYPEGAASLWDLAAGKVRRIDVVVRRIAIPREFRVSDVHSDQETRSRLSEWIDSLWTDKDRILAAQRPSDERSIQGGKPSDSRMAE